MILYAIKHVPTDTFMPARMFRQAHGWSWWEPHETRMDYTPHDPNPRLFYSLRSARNSLTAWLRGPLTRQEVEDGSLDCSATPSSPDYHTEVLPAKHSKAFPRSRSTMLIVSFDLTPRRTS